VDTNIKRGTICLNDAKDGEYNNENYGGYFEKSWEYSGNFRSSYLGCLRKINVPKR